MRALVVLAIVLLAHPALGGHPPEYEQAATLLPDALAAEACFAAAFLCENVPEWIAARDAAEGEGIEYVFGSALAPDGSRLHVAGARSGSAPVVGFLTSFDLDNPGVAWSLDHEGAYFGSTAASATTVVALRSVAGAGSLVAFDAATGTVLWQAASPDDARRVAIDSSRALVVADGSLRAYDLATGALLWDAPAGPGVRFARLAAGHGLVIAGGGEYDRPAIVVRAFHAANGTAAWSRVLESSGSTIPVRALVLSPGALFLGGTRAGGPLVAAFDLATGATRWSDSWPARSFATQALALAPDGATIYAASGGDRSSSGSDGFAVAAYDVGTGARRWSVEDTDLPVAVDWAEAIAVAPNGTVLATGATFADGDDLETSLGRYATLVAFDGATGDLRWFARQHGPAEEGVWFGDTPLWFHRGHPAHPGGVAVAPTGDRAFVAIGSVQHYVAAYPLDHAPAGTS